MGGLGVRNIEFFNWSLLCKWHWIKVFFLARYGPLFPHPLSAITLDKSSTWWRDIKEVGFATNQWFVKGKKHIMGNGDNTKF